jgi:integrase
MASIYKRRKGKAEPYSIQYLDHTGKRRTAKGFTDKGLTEQLAGKLETEARLRRTGLIDAEVERSATIKNAPLAEHVDAFKESLADNSPHHVKVTMLRINAVVAGGDFKCLAELTVEAVQKVLRALREKLDLSHRTYNHYVQAIDSFCNWCVDTHRLVANPLRGLERLNAETDVRHPRRALSPEEVARLVNATRSSGKYVQRLSPELRARAYLFSYFTGLRKQEMASLTPASFKLGDSPATVTVAAKYSKHRRKDVLPLHPDLVIMLREWLDGLKPADKLFPMLGKKKLSFAIERDLKRAGIPYKTAEGIADFHAAGRHTYITQLLRSGASLPEAKELARHSDVKMTMRYTHIGIDDQAKAVANLPSPKTDPKAPSKRKPKGAALQMRCILGGAEGQSASPADNAQVAPKSENPCQCKGLVADRRQLATADKAEGMGFEPTTPCGAPDFESGRWPVRLPSRWPSSPAGFVTGTDG